MPGANRKMISETTIRLLSNMSPSGFPLPSGAWLLKLIHGSTQAGRVHAGNRLAYWPLQTSSNIVSMSKSCRREVEKSCATFLLCDPGSCVHKSDVQNKGMTAHTHTHTTPRLIRGFRNNKYH